jgi:nuclear pore complex protein Nup93
MIGYYTRDFRAANVEAATDYLTLICLNGDLPGTLGDSQASLCHEALRELVLETREIAQLLGDIRSDGTRIRGAIEQRLKLIGLADQEAFLHAVTIQAASVADDNGRTTDAVLLYHLAEDYENVITIINRTLSDALAADIGEEAVRLQPLKPRNPQQGSERDGSEPQSSLSLTAVDDPAELARNMMGLYNSNAMYYQKIRLANRETCGLLLQISLAKGHIQAGRWADALDVSKKNRFLPTSVNAFRTDTRPPPPLSLHRSYPPRPSSRSRPPRPRSPRSARTPPRSPPSPRRSPASRGPSSSGPSWPSANSARPSPAPTATSPASSPTRGSR